MVREVKLVSEDWKWMFSLSFPVRIWTSLHKAKVKLQLNDFKRYFFYVSATFKKKTAHLMQIMTDSYIEIQGKFWHYEGVSITSKTLFLMTWRKKVLNRMRRVFEQQIHGKVLSPCLPKAPILVISECN